MVVKERLVEPSRLLLVRFVATFFLGSLGAFLDFGGHFDDFAALIISAVGTDAVRSDAAFTVAAGDQAI